MKQIAAIVLAVAGWVAAAEIPAVSPTASADGLNSLRNNQGSVQSRIDQLAQPAPQTEAQPGNPQTAPAPGSFPRSFLIPGTDTSIRIGGAVDGTMGYYGH